MRYLYICFVFSALFGLSLNAQETRHWIIDSLNLQKPTTDNWIISDSVISQKSIDETKPIIPEKLEITIEGNSIFSDGDNAPFWLTNNRFGVGSIYKNKGYLRLNSSLVKNISLSNHKFYLVGDIDLIGAKNYNSDFFVQQLYADLTYYNVRLSIGMKERNSLFKNSSLSSGGLTLSENARPIAQVEFNIPDSIPIPSTNHKLFIMGGISYGWFNDGNFKKENSTANASYADKVLYHRKYGFLKFNPNKVWSFIAGLEMGTQWGGHFYKYGQYWDKSPAKIKDFFKVLLPMSGGGNSNQTDRVNIVGNVYGSIHLIAQFKKENYVLKLYNDHFFEDQSGLFYKNIPDGLYGLEINLKKNEWLSDIVIEYLYTKDQSGPFLWDKNEEIPIQVSGGDNYYNHVDYISLSNYGFTLGSPLLTSPLYNNGTSLYIYNTRIQSFHGGIGGRFSSNLKYKVLSTYTRSWGTPLIPSKNIRKQFSGLLEVIYNTYKLPGWQFTGAFAYDNSDIIGNNMGMQIKIHKTFSVYK